MPAILLNYTHLNRSRLSGGVDTIQSYDFNAPDQLIGSVDTITQMYHPTNSTIVTGQSAMVAGYDFDLVEIAGITGSVEAMSSYTFDEFRQVTGSVDVIDGYANGSTGNEQYIIGSPDLVVDYTHDN